MLMGLQSRQHGRFNLAHPHIRDDFWIGFCSPADYRPLIDVYATAQKSEENRGSNELCFICGTVFWGIFYFNKNWVLQSVAGLLVLWLLKDGEPCRATVDDDYVEFRNVTLRWWFMYYVNKIRISWNPPSCLSSSEFFITAWFSICLREISTDTRCFAFYAFKDKILQEPAPHK